MSAFSNTDEGTDFDKTKIFKEQVIEGENPSKPLSPTSLNNTRKNAAEYKNNVNSRKRVDIVPLDFKNMKPRNKTFKNRNDTSLQMENTSSNNELPTNSTPSSSNESHMVLITDDKTGNYVANTVYMDKGNSKYEKYIKNDDDDDFTDTNQEYIINNLQGTLEQSVKTGEYSLGGKKTRRNRRKKIRRSKTIRRRR